MASSSTNQAVLAMIVQFLKEENLIESAHSLERESGCIFDMKYFEVMVLEGELDEAEKYLSGFIRIHDNLDSTRIFFELRKQKFLEALDKNERHKALDILTNEFKDFMPYSDTIYRDATLLLTLDDFRRCGALSKYGNAKAERQFMMNALKKLFTENPRLRLKMQPPTFKNSNFLRRLVLGDSKRSTNARLN
ncbi:topless-related protein 2 [Ricinus communis]|uniref:CTLH domain-containing protein n=1 Tax=Ricinus communis TaxID=3988 RepID=B9RP07_RICCO|nr:topless-related protein 2 [Ricinus communis]EEF46925.1 hypothetical protein RCOM_0922910 [Ricinus communis]|eukprot:XP_002515476.1 topless-related protein 2 [Ricinus communis]